MARRKILKSLRERCDWDDLHHEQERRKGRKDMQRISPELDWHANTALIRGETLKGKLAEDMPELGEPLTERQKGILKTIQEGSIRTGHRLVHGTLDSPHCYRCKKNGREIVETPPHVFWDCQDPSIKQIREKYLPNITKVCNEMGLFDVEGEDRGVDFMEHIPFLNCGLIPEDARLLQNEKELVNFQGHPTPLFDSSSHREK